MLCEMKWLILLIIIALSFSDMSAQFGGPCSISNVSCTVTSISGGSVVQGTSNVAGTLSAGGSSTGSNIEINDESCGELELEVEVRFNWNNGRNNNWVHGISFSASPGWEGTANISPGPNWIPLASITGCCSGNEYGPGYYFEGGGSSMCCGTTDPNNPADNFGAESDPGSYRFQLSYCASANQDQATEEIVFNVTEDGESGDWANSDGCNYEFTFPVLINNSGLQLEEEVGPICVGECITLDAGDGCDNYSWSNGSSTSRITVCPTSDQLFSVVASDGSCSQDGSTLVLVEECCQSESGTIAATPNPTCPGNDVNISISGNNTSSEYETLIIITDMAGVIIEIISGTSHSFTQEECGTWMAHSFNFETAVTTAPSVGENINDVACDNPTECCSISSITISFEDTEAPVFESTNIQDINIECLDQLPVMVDLNWTDNCGDTGSATGEEVSNATICDGGTVTRTWRAVDDCGNESEFTQTITIDALEEASFVNAPNDIVVNCGNIPPPSGDLSVENNGSGDCSIATSVSPTIAEDHSICGGSIIESWNFTDPCGRTITHSRNINIDPAPEASFINPPSDMNFACGQYDGIVEDLFYSNGASGDCEISGSVPATTVGNIDICGTSLTNTWEFTDECGRIITHIQSINIDPSDPPAFINPPGDITLNCGEMPDLVDLFFDNNVSGDCNISGSVSPVHNINESPCGGTFRVTWSFSDPCGRDIEHVQLVTFLESSPAQFINAPVDITVDCTDDIAQPPSLSFDNFELGNCAITGEVIAEESGLVDNCGGSKTYTWTFVDDCNRSISHQQRVTVNPAPAPEWVNPPSDEFISCDEVDDFPPPLSYTNFANDPCDVSGSVDPLVTGSYDSCGGRLIYEWNFSDDCGNAISHTQIIDIEPVPDPLFIDPPDDIMLGCGEDLPEPTALEYTNNLVGVCAIEGVVQPEITNNDDQVIYSYTFFNECSGSEIFHEQIIFLPEEVEINIQPQEFTICANEQYDLFDIEINDIGDNSPVISYHNALPADESNEIFNTIVSPNESTEYYIRAISSTDCEDIDTFTLRVIPAPFAGDDNNHTVCEGGSTVNFIDLLINPDDTNGTWWDIDNSGIDLTDPTDVDISDLSFGEYLFEYRLSSDECLGDTANILLTIQALPTINVLEVNCADNLNTYGFKVLSYGNMISASLGDISGPVNDTFFLENISIEESITINITSTNGLCQSSLTIDPPNCDCPTVDPPFSNGDESICFGENNPRLSVTVNANESAHWYDAPTGGNRLASNALSYTPTVSDIGTYTYYAESVSTLDTNCISTSRTPIRLQITEPPIANDARLSACDENGDRTANFDLNDAVSEIRTNSNHSVEFFVSFEDAENNQSALNSDYTNSISPEIVYARVTDQNGCFTIRNLVLNVYSPLNLDVVIINETCKNSNDGQVILTGNSDNPPIEYAIDGGNFRSNGTFTNLAPGTHSLKIRDEMGCELDSNFTILEGLELFIDFIEIECFNNGTVADASDDFYQVRYQVSNSNNSTEDVHVLIDNNIIKTSQYGTVDSIRLDADGSRVTIVFRDPSNSCEVSYNTTVLNPCSTDCLLSADELSFTCSDNNTPLDPTDDFYQTTFRVEAINGSVTNRYIVSHNGDRVGSYTYGELVTVDIPADGIVANLQFEDLDDDQCRLNISSPMPLVSCSNGCELTAITSNIRCENNGTEELEDDDIFYFDLVVNGIQSSGDFVIQSQSFTGFEGDIYSFGPFAISDGDFSWLVEDEDRSDCNDSIFVSAPPTCSDPCEIEVTQMNIGDCDDNGTGNNDSDDLFDIDVIIADNLGPTSHFEIIIDGVFFNYGSYQQSIAITDLPANGEMITIEFRDTASAHCFTQIEVTQEPCSSCSQVVDAGTDQIISCQDSVVSLTGSSSHPGTFEWLGPNNFTSDQLIVEVSTNGVYYLSAIYPDGCTRFDSVEVTLDSDIPNAYAGEDQVLNCLIREIELLGESNSNLQNVQFIWADDQGDVISNSQSISIDQAGAYYFQVIDNENNCRSPFDEIIVTENINTPDPNIIANPGPILNCVIESIQLTSESEEHVIYTWTIDGEEFKGNSKIVLSEGNVILHALDTISQCDSSSNIRIEDLTEYPNVVLEEPDPITCSSNSTIIDGSRSQSSTNIISEWYNDIGEVVAQDTLLLEVFEPGEYSLTLIDTSLGCQRYDSVLVHDAREVLNIDAGDDILLGCDDELLATLIVSIPDSLNNINVEWESSTGTIVSNSSSKEIEVLGEGEYFVEVINRDNMCSARDSLIVTVNNELPRVSLMEVRDEICVGDENGQLVISEVTGGSPPYILKFENQEISLNQILTNLAPGSYSVMVEDNQGCRIDTVFNISQGRSIAVQTDSLLTIQWGESSTIYAQTSIPDSEIAEIQWQPESNLECDTCLITSIEGYQSENYKVIITDIYGCISSTQIRVIVVNDVNIFIPNTFSPDGNGQNDFFTLHSDKVELISKMTLFDRWGNQVFLKENFKPNIEYLGWDGRYKDKEMNPAVFVYVIEVVLNDGSKKRIKGDVTLLK